VNDTKVAGTPHRRGAAGAVNILFGRLIIQVDLSQMARTGKKRANEVTVGGEGTPRAYRSIRQIEFRRIGR
jgi:hypothetical protein